MEIKTIKQKGEGTGTWHLRSEFCWECAEWPCEECEPDTEIIKCDFLVAPSASNAD